MSSPDSTKSSVEAPAAAQQGPARSSPTTFTSLLDEHARIARQAGYTRRAVWTHVWQTGRFLQALNWSGDFDPVRIASNTDFNIAIERACAVLGFAPKSPSAKTLRSGVNRVRATFLLRHEARIAEVRAPESFRDFWPAFQYYAKIASRLGFLGKIPGTSLQRKPNAGLLRQLGIREGTVTALKRGIRCTVTAQVEAKFAELETLLRAPSGALTRHITSRRGAESEPSRATEHSSRYSQAVRFRYSIATELWPHHLQEELKQFLKGKMGPKWTIRSDGYCGTADNIVRKLEAFVGWLCLPRGDNVWRSGAGRKLEEIQSVFAELVTPDVLDQYREFRLAHTVTEEEFLNGLRATVFNGTLRGLYHFAAELLKAPHKVKLNRPAGFVFQNPDRYAPLLQHLLPTSSFDRVAGRFIEHANTHERWIAFCEKARGAIFEILDGSQGTLRAGKSRSTEAGIEQILALPDPRTALVELLHSLRVDYERVSWEGTPHDKASLCRRQLFFELLVMMPHRVRLWSVLTRRNLEERTNASGQRYYRLHISRAEFKNHRFLDQDYEFSLPVRLTPLIRTYFERAWPILNAPIGTIQQWRVQTSGRVYLTDEDGEVVPIEKDARYAALSPMRPSDRLFGTTFGVSLTKEQRKPVSPQAKTKQISASLQRMCESNTCRFLGRKYATNGFLPHAFRHIIATAEIKVTGSYERAALLLWDSVETVMKAYAHVKRSDLLAKVIESNEALFSGPDPAQQPLKGTIDS